MHPGLLLRRDQQGCELCLGISQLCVRQPLCFALRLVFRLCHGRRLYPFVLCLRL